MDNLPKWQVEANEKRRKIDNICGQVISQTKKIDELLKADKNRKTEEKDQRAERETQDTEKQTGDEELQE